MNTVVIMPGGFHPFHAGHLALYNSAKRAFPDAEVFVAATNDTSERPFPFAVKEKLAKLAGVDPGHFVQVKSPFRANEITAEFDPEQDQLIFVRSEKDADKPPKAGGTKKDGSPAYLQPLLGSNRLEPFARHAYMAYLPTVEFGPGMTSATEIRQTWPGLDDTEKSDLVQNLYPRTKGNDRLTASVVGMLDAAIMGMTEATVINDPQSGMMIRPDGGLGTYDEQSLANNLARQLTEVVAMLQRGNYTGVEHVLYSAGVIESKVRALARLQQFQAKQGNRPIARGREIDIGEDYVAEKCWDTHRQAGMKKKGSRMVPNCVPKESTEPLDEKWSEKYKRSINCANPRGFSQKAHCAGRKK